MKKVIIVLTLILSFNLIMGNVLAKEEEEETFSLEEIVVTASKYEEELSETSVSGEVIDQEDITNKNAYNAADLVKDITGVQINDHGGVAGLKTISIRGSQAEQVLVLVDGQPMNSRQSGQIDLSQLNIDEIERIEVLRGPASAIYGANALGGVVNIITKSGSDEPSTNVKMGYGSFNTQQYSLTQQGGGKKLNYNLAVTAKKSDGHRDIPDNSDLEQYNLFTKFDYQLNNYSDLILSLRYNDSDKETPGKITNPSPNAQQNDEDKNINVAWKEQREDTDTKVLAYYNQHEQNFSDKYYSNQDDPADFNNYYRDQDGDVYYYDGSEKKEVTDINLTENITNSIHDTKRMGLDFSRTNYYQDHTLSYGSTVKQNEIDSNKNGEHETLNKALFVQDKWAVNEALTINLGSRYDDHDQFGSEISPRAGLVYEANQNVKLHLSGGQAYRTPTFNDLYWPADPY
ncbi:MAG: TonB-dependent receptor, partial [Halanaerobacter sp.]